MIEWDEAVATQRRAIQIASKTITEENVQILRDRLAQYEKQQPYRQEKIAARPAPPPGRN